MAPVHLRSFTLGSEVWREVFISPLLMSVVFARASVSSAGVAQRSCNAEHVRYCARYGGLR